MMNTAHESGEARALDRALAAARRGVPPPAARPRDLDALGGLLAAHADALREAVPPPPPVAVAPRQSPRVLAATVAAAAILLLCVVSGVRVAPLAPAPVPLAPAAAMPMAIAPVSARMMGFSIEDAHTAYPTIPPTVVATVAPPAAGTARPYRVVAPGRGDVLVRAAPDTAAPAVMTVFNGMAIDVVGERVAGAAGDPWYPVQVGAVRGFLRADLLQPGA